MGRLWKRVLAVAFRLLYNELAWTYDLVAWLVSFGEWKAWGQVSLDYLAGRRVLELGHGPGHLLAEMDARGLSPVGIDLSVSMGRLARRRLRAHGTPAPLVHARAQQLPFQDRAFDSVVAAFPTEFIVDSTALKEANRVLGVQGRLVSIPAVRFAGTSIPARLLRSLYKATGQSAPLPQSRTRLRATGFKASWDWVAVRGAEVLLLVAQK